MASYRQIRQMAIDIRRDKLEAIWRATPAEYRITSNGRRYIMKLVDGSTMLVPLSTDQLRGSK